MFGTKLFKLPCLVVIVLAGGCNLFSDGDKGVKAKRVSNVHSIFAPHTPIRAPLPQTLSNEWELQIAQIDPTGLINRESNWFGDFHINWRKDDDPPTPIPGRLLVEIDPAELRESFGPGNASCDPAPFIREGLLPPGLKISKIDYLAQQTDQRVVLRVTLKSPLQPDDLRMRFSKLRSSTPKLEVGSIINAGTRNFVLTLGKRDLKLPWAKVCTPDFIYLKADSALRGEFNQSGILSMQRVFRSTEMPDPTRPGYFKVRKFHDLLAAAKNKFPKRTARAYPDIVVVDNLENWFVLELEPYANLDKVIKALSQFGGVRKVSADYPVLAATNDPEFQDQWALNNTGSFQSEPPVPPGFDINAETAWSAAATTQSVVIAVLDTGFKEDLDELQNRLWTNPDEIAANDLDDDCNGYIDDIHGISTYDPGRIDYSALPACSVSPGRPAEPIGSHGTEMAGLIAAEADNNIGIAGVVGTDPVKLMNITIGRLARYARLNSSAEVAEALMYALEKGADIANMAFATRGLPICLHDVIHASLDAGMILVGSAGADAERFTKAQGYSSFGVFPASMNGVISVGGSMRNGQWWPESNYGPGLDFVAPAFEIRTLSYDSTNPAQTVADIVTVSGTSASAAITSGAAAVILGRYPAVTAPYMRQWLRATARDILDPQGVGANLPGDDEWTGAGMLDLGTATVVLADPLDQPLNADILVERLTLGPPSHFSDHAPDAVAGSPDLGITVMGPTCQPGVLAQPVSCALGSWRLEYGIGDSPALWTPIAIPDPNPSTPVNENGITPIDVARTGSSYFRHTEVAPGSNYLNTDLFQNEQLYTIRLIAENKAGREFVSYDWFIPIRAKITNPSHNETINSRWGWTGLDGFVDIRPNASYVVSLADDAGVTLWSSSPFSPAGKYDALVAAGYQSQDYYQGLADNWGTSASAYISTLIVENTTLPDWRPEYPQSDPAAIAEGWVDLSLNVQTDPGATERDSVRLYLDTSHFPNKTNFPVPTTHSITAISPAALSISDLGGSVGRRIIAGYQRQIRCLDANGVHHWAADSYIAPVDGDVDNDGTSEILTSTTENFFPGMGNPGSGPPASINVLVHLWSGDSCADNGTQDGTLHNINWPVTYSFVSTDNDGWFHFSGTIGGMAIADITGDSAKEIIFYQRPNNYYGLPVADIRPGYLRVLNADGSELWNQQFYSNQTTLPFKVEDIDSDGKAEILLESQGLIVQGDNTFRSGWDAVQPFQGGEFVMRNSGNQDILLYRKSSFSEPNYEATLVSRAGAVRPNWPISFSSNVTPDPIDPHTLPANLHVLAGQVVPGANEEIIFCENKISAFAVDGQKVMPDIDLTGSCQGLTLANVDGDSALELVVLVHRLQQNVLSTQRRGAFVEAYDLDGTRLGDGDNRWPVVVSTARPSALNETTSIGDINGDGINEIVQQLQIRPYRGQMSLPNPRNMIEVLELN